jgi:hypothetical protein
MAYFVLLCFFEHPATTTKGFCNIAFVRLLLSTAAGMKFSDTHGVTHNHALALLDQPFERICLVRQPRQKKDPDR